jgi:nucleoid-associated protein YgaU
MPNYYDDETGVNDSENYESLFEQRGIKSIKQFRTKTFEDLDLTSVKVTRHIWGQGDTLHRLAIRYYGVPDYWWTIAIINGKPTDAHYKLGDTVFIPKSPDNLKRRN